MAVFYSYAINELVRVTSSLSNVVLGTLKHVVMALISAVFIDHVLGDGEHVTLTATGLAGFIPATTAYAYFMLTHTALEPWSWKSVERSYCFEVFFAKDSGGKADAAPDRPTLEQMGITSVRFPRKSGAAPPKGLVANSTAADFI
jgi:branched-subunit amino acid transport protein